MIDVDDDVRLHHRHDLSDPDLQPSEAAEIHFASGIEYDFPGVLKPSRHERYVDDITGQPLFPELCKKARATGAICGLAAQTDCAEHDSTMDTMTLGAIG